MKITDADLIIEAKIVEEVRRELGLIKLERY